MCLDTFTCASRRVDKFVKEFLSKHQGLFQKALHLFKKVLSSFSAIIFSYFFAKKNGCVFLHTHLNMIKIVLLLGNDQVVVLLTALNEQVFFIKQVSSSNYLVESSELFLVQRNTTTLNELTHFAL